MIALDHVPHGCHLEPFSYQIQFSTSLLSLLKIYPRRYRFLLDRSSKKDEGMFSMKELGAPRRRPTFEDEPIHEQIEFILKIPRSLDPKLAEEINERHRLFVEQEINRFSLALKDAERLFAECKPSSRQSREDARGNI